MPETEIVIYQKDNGRVPLVEWLQKQSHKVQDRSIELVKLLKERGYTLRRPHVENLGDDIYELRIIVKRVQHRILYCFVGQNIVLLTHGITKTDRVPPKEINKATEFRDKYVQNPELHTYKMERLL